MILGKCDDKLTNTLASIDLIADEICLLQTIDDEFTTDLITKFDFTSELIFECDETLMHEDGFLRSFSEARNASFALATGDMIMWIDSDDVIFDPTKLRDAIEKLDKKGVDWIRMDYDYEFDTSGNCTTRHRRERIVRNGYARWIAPIHEVMEPTRKGNIYDMERDVSYIIHNNIKDGDSEPRQIRNVTMLKRIVDEGGDQRMKMYYGNSLFDIGKYDEAISYYKEYLEESNWDEEKYQVMIRIHNVYRKKDEYTTAKAWCLKAMELNPEFKHAFICLAEIDAIHYKWDRVIHWMKLYNQCDNMGMDMIHNPTGEEIQPLLLLQRAYHETADWERTMSCTVQLRKLAPDREAHWNAVDSHCMKQIEDMRMIDAYKQVLEFTPKKNHQMIYDAIPERISDYPSFKMNKKKVRPDGKKVLAIYCGYDPTSSWGPESIKTGIGGSEEAVINVSKEFVKLGWTVEVYCNCTQEGLIDGVNWYQTAASNNSDTVDLCILWRHPHHVFKAPNGKVTWVWNHDLQDGMEPFYDEDVMSRIDKVMFLSDFHRTTAPWIHDDKVMITRNGVDPSLMVSGDNDPYKVVYASSPDRGLDTLLEMWPEIVRAHPKARLEVFYGFNKWFDARYANDKGMMEWKERLLIQMENDPTITYFGSVGQEDLAQHIATAGVWAYPTRFGEISCITAMKMQCGGVIPVTANYAALHETVRFGHKIGEYMKPVFDRQEFLRTLISVVGNKEDQEAIRPIMIDDARSNFRWDGVAEEWNAEFVQCSELKLKLTNNSKERVLK